ncbi:MAG: glycosyltransferase family 2 protein [Chitinophagales bacterium]
MTISAVIITHNEAARIAPCIASVRPVVDEVVVIDSFSSDETVAIARSAGAIVHQQAFAGYGQQKNDGAALALHPYILSIDADEIISETLAKSILQLKANLNNDTAPAAVQFKRLNYVGARAVITCGWYPDKKIRLYDKRRCCWNERHVHETVDTKDHEPVLITGDLLHFSYDDEKDIQKRTEVYALRGAQAIQRESRFILFWKMMVNPVWKGFRSFFMQRGFVDGKLGWVISRERARETFLKYRWALWPPA